MTTDAITGRHPLTDMVAGLFLAGAGAQFVNGVADRVWPSALPGRAWAGGILTAGLALLGARFTRNGVSEGFQLAGWLVGGATLGNALTNALPQPPVDAKGRFVDAGASSDLESLLQGKVTHAWRHLEVVP